MEAMKKVVDAKVEREREEIETRGREGFVVEEGGGSSRSFVVAPTESSREGRWP